MSDKTEQPTPKKLRDARKKGQVAKSKEVSSAALITVIFALMLSLAGGFVLEVRDMILAPPAFYEMEFERAADGMMQIVQDSVLAIIVPVLAATAVVGIVSNMAQVGLMFSAESVKPKLGKLNPASKLKQMVSLKNLVEFLKSVVKIAFLSILLFLVIRGAIRDLVKIPACGLDCILPVLASLFTTIAGYTIAAFVIIAFADYVYQKIQFNKEHMMTKDEVKREYKESEGDPHIKGKRKQFAHELLTARMEDGVRKSKVVVTNPTHIAIALEYERGRTPLPIVRAKGQGIIAHRIVQIAREAGIPIMQNVPLARALHEDGELGGYIPVDLIEEVAAVLRWVAEIEAANEPG